jgi:glutamyl-tRNA reductase
MSGELLALGASHKTAPLDLRERLALTEGRATAVLAELTAREEIAEAVALSTCNRTEVYVVAGDAVAAESAVLSVLSRQAERGPTELTDSLYALRGLDVATHLFAVTAGLDSMIVGEAEIQGQVKRAYELALVEGMTGPISNRLFRAALAAGKHVRTQTGVGRTRVSVATVAAELACKSLGASVDAGGDDLADHRVLVIGAGEQGERTAQALHDRGAHAVFVANRHYDRALGLAQRYSGSAVPLDELPTELARADIVVSCTSSPHQLLGREELELVMGERGRRPLVVIDTAVPRDVDPTVREVDGVALYDMDDLQREVARNRSVREAEAARARTLVERDVERFRGWLAGLDVLPTIAALRARADTIVGQVLEENERRWEALSDADRERLGALTRALVARLLHEPTLRLKEGADGEGSYRHIAAVRELFGLDATAAALDEGAEAGAEVTELDSRRRRRG